MSGSTDIGPEVIHDNHDADDSVEHVGQTLVQSAADFTSVTLPTAADPPEMEIKVSPSQLPKDSTPGFHSSSSSSCASSADHTPLTNAQFHRPFLSTDTSLLSVEPSNASSADMDFPSVQFPDAASCPASPMPPHEAVLSTSSPSTSGSAKLASRSAHSSSSSSSAAAAASATGAIKRPRHKPGERRELLARAVEDVVNLNISMRRAAQKYNLAKSSLCDFVRKNKISLPNLRFKTCPSGGPDPLPASLRSVGASCPTAAHQTPLGLKRLAGDTGDEFQHAGVKFSCSSERKACSVSKARDAGSLCMNSSDQKSTGAAGSRTNAAHSQSRFCDSPLPLDSLDIDQSVTKTSYASLRSNTPTSHTGSTLLSNRPSSVTHTSKASRIESPWHNAAGLPTQVPMRSWTVTHNPPSVNGTALNSASSVTSSSSSNTTSTTIATGHNNVSSERKLTYNSLIQLRQTLDPSSGLVVNLSDSSAVDHTTPANLMRSLTEVVSGASELPGPRLTPSSDDGELLGCPTMCPDGTDTVSKPHGDSKAGMNQSFHRDADVNSEVHRGTYRIEINGTGEPLQTNHSRLDSRSTPIPSSPQFISDSLCNTGGSSGGGLLPTANEVLNSAQTQDLSSLVYSLPVGFGNSLTAVSTVGLGSSSCLSDANLFTRSRESRLPIPPFDSSAPLGNPLPDCPVSISLSANAAAGGQQPLGAAGVNPIASFSAAPASFAPFLTATDFSAAAANPAAAVVAALLLQHHSRALSSSAQPSACPTSTGPTSISTLPNLIGYPANLTYPIPGTGATVNFPGSGFPQPSPPHSASSLFSTPTDLTLTSNSNAPYPNHVTSASTTTVLRLGSRPPSVQSLPANTTTTSTTAQPSLHPGAQLRLAQPTNLSNLSISDLLQQLGADELHPFLTRQQQPPLQTRLAPDPTGIATQSPSSVFTTALSAQLLPHLFAQPTNSTLRQLLTAIVGSIQPKTVNLMSNLGTKPTNTATSVADQQTAVPTVDNLVVPNPLQLSAPPTLPDTSALVDLAMSANMAKLYPHAKGLVDFINKSPSPFHVVHTACELLTANGFRELKEHEPWTLSPSDCVFIKKNGSTVIAAAVGGKFKPGNPFHLIGAHTDSPCLRLKPFSERVKEGYVQLGVETYGGGLWYTWFDRELKIAGRAVIANAASRLEERLVHLDRPIACVPSLAIHLNQEIKSQGFQPNTEQHVAPILCTCLMDQVQNVDGTECVQPATGTTSTPTPLGKRRHPAGLLRVIAQDLGVTEHELLELELYFADCQPARIGGLHNEFVHAPRLDNLFNSYTSLCGLVGSMSSLAEDSAIRLVCLYDHEEIGSTSTQGANSSYTLSLLRRLVDALLPIRSDKTGSCEAASEPGAEPGAQPAVSASHFEESLSKSFLLSADQAHAVHPSYHERHEANHKAQLHCGLILKYNSAQRYATNALTAAAVRQIAQTASVPVQEFTPRQDMHCGSTIGPLLSSQLGIPTADVGFPQLAMHSCRELCCTTSVSQAVRFYSAFYEQLSKHWPPERA